MLSCSSLCVPVKLLSTTIPDCHSSSSVRHQFLQHASLRFVCICCSSETCHPSRRFVLRLLSKDFLKLVTQVYQDLTKLPWALLLCARQLDWICLISIALPRLNLFAERAVHLFFAPLWVFIDLVRVKILVDVNFVRNEVNIVKCLMY